MAPGVDPVVLPLGQVLSSMTLERPKSVRTARPSSVISTLFCMSPELGLVHLLQLRETPTPLTSPCTIGAGRVCK